MSDRLEEIKARRAAVRHLPWEIDGSEIISPEGQWLADVAGVANLEFFANAPADIDWLIGQVENLEDALDARLQGLESKPHLPYWAGVAAAYADVRKLLRDPDWLAATLRGDPPAEGVTPLRSR